MEKETNLSAKIYSAGLELAVVDVREAVRRLKEVAGCATCRDESFMCVKVSDIDEEFGSKLT